MSVSRDEVLQTIAGYLHELFEVQASLGSCAAFVDRVCRARTGARE